MTRRDFTRWGLACAAAPWFSAEPLNALSEDERRDGFELLFDGKTTNGWVEITGKPFPANCWAIEDGCLRTLVREDGFQDIRTVGTYRSFELRLDWKAGPDGNSGVKYLIQRVDEWVNKRGRQARARGLEYQVCDDATPDLNHDPKRMAGALYSVIPPRTPTEPAVGVFHEARIVLRGRHAEHWLDGVKVVEFSTDDPAVAVRLNGDRIEGPVSLQNHQSEAWFRNLRIRRLPD